MKITYYGYNTFIIQSKNIKIAIDPGGSLYLLKGWLKSLIPISEWESITHIFVTHGDPDHYWHFDRVAKKSNAPVVCNENMVKAESDKRFLLDPRHKGLVFTTEVAKIHTVSPNKTIQVDELSITGIHTTHGPLMVKMGPFHKKISPGPKERIGWGSIGFEINVHHKKIVNLGDTLLRRNEWKNIIEPDVLMIPIGGAKVYNTMNEQQALQAVEMIKPKLVIPCHYNCSALFYKNANATDETFFQKKLEQAGFECAVLQNGFSIESNDHAKKSK